MQEKDLDHNVVVIVDLDTELSEEENQLLAQASQKGASVLLNNAKQEVMTEIWGAGTDAKFVIVKSTKDQLKHEITVLLDSEDISVEESSIESEESNTEPVEEPSKPVSNNQTTPPTPIELLPVEVKTYEEVDIIAHRLQDASFLESDISPSSTQVSQPRGDIRYYTIIFTNVGFNRHTFIDSWRDSRTLYSSTGAAFNVKIYAPRSPERKFLQINSLDQVSVRSLNYWQWNNWGWWGTDRGSYNFTARANVTLYPGKHNNNPMSSIGLPAGWTRSQIAPQTANNVNQYQSTTGWVLSASGGFDGLRPVGTLTAELNSSTVVTRNIPEFTVRNESTLAVSSWRFFLTHYENSWRSALDGVSSNLARGFFSLQNECVYNMPNDFNETRQPFTFELAHTVPQVRQRTTGPGTIPPSMQNEYTWRFHKTVEFDFSRVHRL